ncbi:MAG: hypothetical protein ACREJ3_16440, partial [Polyangiaceae bacterium]
MRALLSLSALGVACIVCGARDAPPARGWDWNGVLGTGQSLSVGAMASVPVRTTQRFHNLKLSLGRAHVTMPTYDANDPALSVVPLVEPIRAETTGYP